MKSRWQHFWCAFATTITVIASSAHASPLIDPREPVYDEVSRQIALGRLPLSLGGFEPLSEHRIHALLGEIATNDEHVLLDPRGWWISPIHRLTVRGAWARDRRRNYSTVLRPRNVAGSLSPMCERRAGRACGDGAGTATELETSAGYGWLLSGTLGIESVLGTEAYEPNVNLVRALVVVESDTVTFAIGRDAFVLGPSAHTALAWGLHTPPLDQARITTSRPLHISSAVRVSGQYIVGRLRAPQTYPGNLVSLTRAQLDLGDDLSLGAHQMLQLGGEGAPSIGVIDFLLEHVRRRDSTASNSDSSNRRFGVDINARVRELKGLRLYYALMFEDIRRARAIDAIRYDADHLVGAELAALGPQGRHGLTLEWHMTGVRSQEHSPRTTGFTNADRVVGAPLGPDAESVFAGARLAFGALTLYPWLELAQLSSDSYEFIAYGPINRVEIGEDETRYRAGARIRVALNRDLHLEAEAVVEHIDDFAFEAGVTRTSAGITTSIIWYPRRPVGRIELN